VRIAVADTSPIRYLVLIGRIEILPALFEKIVIPTAVRDELAHPSAPDAVRNWIQAQASWLELRDTSRDLLDSVLESLDEGERAALKLAAFLDADIVLLDDRQGARAARSKGFRVIGTLRILHLAAERGLLEWADSFERLTRTNFR